MKPTTKAPALTNFLEDAFGRSTHITSNTCVMCKSPVLSFKDELSEREYRISGLCQTCQDSIYNNED